MPTYDILRKVVREASCFSNWSLRVEDESKHIDVEYPRLVIRIEGENNYTHAPYIVDHYHPAPSGVTYNEKTWRRWVYDQCLRTMNHEIGEALVFNGERPFAPMHGPGEDPYTIHEIRSEADALMTQNGSLRPPPV